MRIGAHDLLPVAYGNGFAHAIETIFESVGAAELLPVVGDSPHYRDRMLRTLGQRIPGSPVGSRYIEASAVPYIFILGPM